MEAIGPIIYLIFAIVPLALGFTFGKISESMHYKNIRQREKQTLHKPVVSWKTPKDGKPIHWSRLAVGSVVISVDHYKRFLMGFRKIFGGEVQSYSSLLDRGRREAVLRMKEKFPNADLFLNCRIETSAIFNGQGNATGSVEVVAYSTAVQFGT
jgi:uncharacterized protein YbjQ (UPF0145 family)